MSAWLDAIGARPISEAAQRVLMALERDGASFFDELVSATTLSSRALRDALRELVGAGIATNDTMESLRLVTRWRPMVSATDRETSTRLRLKNILTCSKNRLSFLDCRL